MEYHIFLAILVETGTIDKDKAKKLYESLRYKNFPVDFDGTLKVVKGAFDSIAAQEKLNKKLKNVAPKK